uniref:Uncharacterized protein n=1 Tax=Rhizophora mucronata TaxID=61149 RepID=A0A2P2QVH0_RHIMU
MKICREEIHKKHQCNPQWRIAAT